MATHENGLLGIAKVFIFPLIVPVLVGIGASALTTGTMVMRLDERFLGLERRVTRNEAQLETLRGRVDEQGRQLASFDSVFRDIGEIKADLKGLMRGRNGR